MKPSHGVREGCVCSAQVPALVQSPADGHQPLEPKKGLEEAELMEEGGGDRHVGCLFLPLPARPVPSG